MKRLKKRSKGEKSVPKRFKGFPEIGECVNVSNRDSIGIVRDVELSNQTFQYIVHFPFLQEETYEQFSLAQLEPASVKVVIE